MTLIAGASIAFRGGVCQGVLPWDASRGFVISRETACQSLVIRAVRDGGMAQSLYNSALMEQKNAWQLKSIARHHPQTMSICQCLQVPAQHPRPKQLRQSPAMQPESTIEDCIGIREPGDAVKVVSGKDWSSLLLASLIHERQLRSGRLDRPAPGFHVGQGLAAERSPKMAQEYQQDRGGSGEVFKASAILVARRCQGFCERLTGCSPDGFFFHSFTRVVLPKEV